MYQLSAFGSLPSACAMAPQSGDARGDSSPGDGGSAEKMSVSGSPGPTPCFENFRLLAMCFVLLLYCREL